MSENSNKTRRIADNTVLLFIRMAVTMVIALYASRVVLKALGVTDYGIYNVVGGVVFMMRFLSESMSGATSRYISFAIGEGKKERLNHLFGCIFTIHVIIALVILLLSETVGLWFVTEKLVIPENRKIAAAVVFETTLLNFFITTIAIPYDALLIAYERMKAFAYISITEVSVRLLIAFSLFVIPYDRLIVFSVLVLALQQMILFIYMAYCHRYLPDFRPHLVWDRKLSREIFSYVGWILNGNLAVVGYTQGLNILLNLFFGPAVNAARGVSVQVQNAVNQCFDNFQMAVNPQITKSYAEGDMAYMHRLVLYSSKFSFFIALVVILPLMYETPYVLRLWLGDVPAHTVNFVRIMLLISLCNTLRNPVLIAIRATGDIRKFQIVEGSILLSIVPLAYVGLKFYGFRPENVFEVYLAIEAVTQIVRTVLVLPRIKLPTGKYISGVVRPVFVVAVISASLSYPLRMQAGAGFMTFVLNVLVTLSIALATVGLLGLKSKERSFVMNMAKSYILKIFGVKH